MRTQLPVMRSRRSVCCAPWRVYPAGRFVRVPQHLSERPDELHEDLAAFARGQCITITGLTDGKVCGGEPASAAYISSAALLIETYRGGTQRVPAFETRTAFTQEDLDCLAEAGFDGRIIIVGGTLERPLRLSARMKCRPLAVGDTCVAVSGNARVRAVDNAVIIARGHADVAAFGESMVRAGGMANVQLHDASRAVVKDRASLKAYGNSRACVYGCRRCIARGNAQILGFEKITAYLYQKARAWTYQASRAYPIDETARVITR